MKTVKINYACESDDFNREQNLIYDLLKINGYDVQISDDPDYIICDVGGAERYGYCKYPQIRIMYSGENYIPDFNLIDYSICPYPIQFGDRNFQLPPCVWPRDRWLSIVNKRGGDMRKNLYKINNSLQTLYPAMSRNSTSAAISSRS